MLTAYAEVDCAASAPYAPEDEQQQLLAHVAIVKRVVRQLSSGLSGAVDREDLYQVGLLGLLDALRRYGEPDDRFPAYAAVRVRGAILDELRRQDWRPRGVRREIHRIRDGIRELTRRLGREPTQAEIMKELQLTPDAWREFELAESAEDLANLDELIHELPESHGMSRNSPEAQLLIQRSIEQALSALDEREQRVVQLYYEFDLSLKEIAAVLGVTEARVCQINKAALKKMKDRLR
ncbi:MAG TPA: FliA/WhiG family RNA polymerase sigma factor [Steroidobacteraceae bacterium]|jgi:RNA polymerase sigma factor for flagellar operon FliA